jgi:hypothetical protein
VQDMGLSSHLVLEEIIRWLQIVRQSNLMLDY